jgi:peptidoglycan hydrolase-like protein with peptidoglycan-binding domain
MAMIVAAALGASGPAAAQKKAPAAQKNRTPTAKKAASVHRTAGTSPTARKKGAKQPVTHAVTWRNRQIAPSPDRYKEIQQALAAKGYLPPEQASGVWDQNSVDALKRFQTEQNLDASGKINSLSLIALGLGPKHDSAATQTAVSDESRR